MNTTWHVLVSLDNSYLLSWEYVIYYKPLLTSYIYYNAFLIGSRWLVQHSDTEHSDTDSLWHFSEVRT